MEGYEVRVRPLVSGEWEWVVSLRNPVVGTVWLDEGVAWSRFGALEAAGTVRDEHAKRRAAGPWEIVE